MSHPSPEQLGPPTVRLNAFQLWVHGRQFPEAQDQWDGNWLNVTHCGQTGASIWATGAILDSIGLMRFRDELGRLHQTLSGEAVLESHEPNVRVRVASSNADGHLHVRAEIRTIQIDRSWWAAENLRQVRRVDGGESGDAEQVLQGRSVPRITHR